MTGDYVLSEIWSTQVVSNLPETVDVKDLVDRLHLLDKIEQAEKQLARGEGVSHGTAKQS